MWASSREHLLVSCECVFLKTAFSFRAFPPDRQACCVCRQQYGACLQCDAPNCLVAYHAVCAMKAGFFMDVVTSPTTGKHLRCTFCPRHK